MKHKYYQISINESEKTAEIYIYGDITSDRCTERDVSSYMLSKEIQKLPEDIKEIKVYINSYGGEVFEGWAIYNLLKRHPAEVTTYCDGIAASIAGVIFMAGDKRIMNTISMLFVHNVWSYAVGNAEGLRKVAEDLEKMSKQSMEAFLEHINISEEALKELMDNESWLNPTECLDMGFCTAIEDDSNSDKASQSVKKKFMQKVTKPKESGNPDPTPKPPENKNTMLEIIKNL